MTLDVSIIIPERVFWEKRVEEIILPTLSGQMGVLKDHIPILTGLDIGIILVRQKSSSDWTSLVVTGGFALINSNNVTILVNEAEFGSEINVEQAQISYNSSKHALEMNKDIKRKFELTLNLKKARARFQVTQLKK